MSKMLLLVPTEIPTLKIHNNVTLELSKQIYFANEDVDPCSTSILLGTGTFCQKRGDKVGKVIRELR